MPWFDVCRGVFAWGQLSPRTVLMVIEEGARGHGGYFDELGRTRSREAFEAVPQGRRLSWDLRAPRRVDDDRVE